MFLKKFKNLLRGQMVKHFSLQANFNVSQTETMFDSMAQMHEHECGAEHGLQQNNNQ